MRYATTAQLLEYIRQHPDCRTNDLVNKFYPRETTLPCDITSGRDNINSKLGGLRRRRWIVNICPGRENQAVWRAVA